MQKLLRIASLGTDLGLRLAAASGTLVLAVLADAPLQAQEWILPSGPATRADGGFDPRRGRFVAIDANRVWERLDDRWVAVPVGSFGFAPAPRLEAAFAFDEARGELLVFGGRQISTFGDFWAWDGTRWRDLLSAPQPPRRSDAGMAYDPVAREVVLHGGFDQQQGLGDTWLWNGTAWRTIPGQLSGGTSRLAYDVARQQMHLLNAGGHFRLQGSTWTQASLQTSTTHCALVYDAARSVLVQFRSDTQGRVLEWNGTAWNTVLSRADASMSNPIGWFDPRLGAVVFHGVGRPAATWDGTTWTPFRWSIGDGPATLGVAWSTAAGGMAIDRETAQSTSARTWRWNGADWSLVPTLTSPPARVYSSAAFDPQSGTSLLFGGQSTSNLGDTWVWNGTDWSQRPVAGPPPRILALMAHDTGRNRTLLTGGVTNSGLANDTWEWDGSVWRSVQASPTRTVSAIAAIAFDPVRARTVLVDRNATFEWNGAAWSVGVAPPQVVNRTTLVFDATRGRLLLSAIELSTSMLEYDGVTWSPTPWPGVADAALFALREPVRGRLQLVGQEVVRQLAQTPLGLVDVGSACGTPPAVLGATATPWLGESQFALDVACGPAQPVFVALAVTETSLPLGNGCSQWIGPPLGVLFAVADAVGRARVPVPLPAASWAIGATFTAQGLAAAPSSPGGFASTQGLRVTIGD